MRLVALAMVLLCGGLFIYASLDFPGFADPQAPAHLHLSPHFITKTMSETSVPNIVTAVLADYRGYDTMFETTVIFAAGVACFFLLRTWDSPQTGLRTYRHLVTGMIVEIKRPTKKSLPSGSFQEIDQLWTPYDLIIMTVSKILVPFIQVFGLYVIAHGHHSPGGGFQGGVILGASVVLLAICFDLRTVTVERLRESLSAVMSAIGVFIYAGVGALCLAQGAAFLDYSALAPLLSVDPISARSLGIFFVEVGVGLAVMATMISIYNNLASAGAYNQGL